MRLQVLIAGKRCVHALWWCLAASTMGSFAIASEAVTLAEKAKESGCVSKPQPVQETLYRCSTESGAFSYFNVPGVSAESRGGGTGNSGTGNSRSKKRARSALRFLSLSQSATKLAKSTSRNLASTGPASRKCTSMNSPSLSAMRF